MPPEKEFAHEWLKKAHNDLVAAKAILESPYAVTDAPCFHAQQCVEKALKGWLTWHGIGIGRTHDLMFLLAEVVKTEPVFLEYKDVCEQLSSFAVDVRYPGGLAEPPRSEVEKFYDQAKRIYKRIEQMIREV